MVRRCLIGVVLLLLSACGTRPNPAWRGDGGSLDADEANPPDQDTDATRTADVELDIDRQLPIVRYQLTNLTDISTVFDMAERTPDVPLTPDEAEPSGLTPTIEGVEFSGGQLDATLMDSMAFGDAILETGSFTVEIWAFSDDDTQRGPARIVTYSSGTGQRGFTLGQDHDDLILRLRTTATDSDGSDGPSGRMVIRAGAFPTNMMSQLVAAFDASDGYARLYVNGALGSERQHLLEDETIAELNWETEDERFAVGDEIGVNRSWLGTIESVTVFDRALDETEIQQRYEDHPQ